jgi:predicted Zn-dependent protease
MHTATPHLVLLLLLFAAVPLQAQAPSPNARADASGGKQASAGVAAAPVRDAGGASPLPAIRRKINAGHAEEALRDLDALGAASPAESGVQTLRGLIFYQQARFPEADKAFAAALAQNPRDLEAAQMRGLTLFRLGRPADAIPLLEGSQTWSADTKVDPSYVLALCYLDTHRYDDARHAFAVQYDLPPNSAAAYLLAARMLFRREYLPIAREYAEKSLAMDPQLPLAHGLLGEIALAGDHMDEAIAELEKERAHDPLDGPLYDRLGDAYYRSGRYQEAQRSLQRALLLEPNSTGPYILLGKVLLKRQDPLGAATYLERAKAMDPANYRTRSLLGQAYRALGRPEDATRETQMAQSLQTASEPKLETGR